MRRRHEFKLQPWSLLVLFSMWATPLWSQVPPRDFENLQVLSPELSHRELIHLMKEYSRSLGVRCEHCHVGAPDAPLAEFDFVSDKKKAKETARQMMRMTQDINQKYLGALGSARLEVRCMTCHHGQLRPLTLEQRLIETLEKDGLAAALEAYRELRTEFFGAATYDFRAEPLNRLARDLARKKKYPAAQAFLELNLEHHPEDAGAHFLLGEVLLKQGRKTQAAASYRKALQHDPKHTSAQLRLEELAGG